MALGGNDGKDKAISMSYSAKDVGDERLLAVFVKSSNKSSISLPPVDLDFKAADKGFNFIAKSSLGKLNCGKFHFNVLKEISKPKSTYEKQFT